MKQIILRVNKFLDNNKKYRKQTKNIKYKGRKFMIENYYNGILDLILMTLCSKNIGAEDYIRNS